MADSKKYIGIYNTLEDVQDALDNGQLSKPYVAKTMDNGKIDYNSLSPVDYSQYWCTYYPLDAKIWVKTEDGLYSRPTEYTGGDGKISKADFPNFYYAGSNKSAANSTITKFKYFQFDSTSDTVIFSHAWNGCRSLTSFPLINTANGKDFSSAWKNCSSLTEFPMLDVSKGTDFAWAWAGCSSLTEFPMLDLSNGTEFGRTWDGCSSLTTMPALDLSSGTDFSGAWEYCSSLTTLGGFGAISANFSLAYSPNLTVESLMNVITQAATVTGKTMTLGGDNLAKLTDEQKAVATSKGWTLA